MNNFFSRKQESVHYFVWGGGQWGKDSQYHFGAKICIEFIEGGGDSFLKDTLRIVLANDILYRILRFNIIIRLARGGGKYFLRLFFLNLTFHFWFHFWPVKKSDCFSGALSRRFKRKISIFCHAESSIFDVHSLR